LLLALLSCPPACGEPGDTWTQWRGPQRDGQFEGQPWPDSIAEQRLKQQWRIELGPSYSGPIVSDSLVFTTASEQSTWEQVTAYDRTTGEKKWETRWKGAISVPFFARSNGSWIRATPAYDGERLYVAGMRDLLVCLDAATGKELWKVDFVEKFATPLPSFGFVCSPLLDGEFVYVQAGGGFCKLNKRTGEVVWRTLEDGGGMYGSAFSSPAIATLNDTRQALVQTRQVLAGVDLETGEVLWSEKIPATRGMNILTPTVHEEKLFTSSHGGKTWLFELAQDDAKTVVEPMWESKLQGYMSSPVVIAGHAYLHMKNQRFACIDLQTGKEKWITTPYGKYWSMVAQGDKILALDERGELLLIRATPEKFDLLESRKISQSPTWAHLALCNGQLLIREQNALVAYEWK
ncbi:MAG: PQQ-binding-like beta-propeller repeat protein, partial [Pirellulales bacterium]